MVEQLRACGIIETIRISAAGFPSRYLYKEFIDRYWILLPRVQLQTLRREELERDQIKLCQVILRAHINVTIISHLFVISSLPPSLRTLTSIVLVKTKFFFVLDR